MIHVETTKPESLADITEDLYYMYSNSHDSLGTTYMKITNDKVLEVAYKVYKKVEEDKNKL